MQQHQRLNCIIKKVALIFVMGVSLLLTSPLAFSKNIETASQLLDYLTTEKISLLATIEHQKESMDKALSLSARIRKNSVLIELNKARLQNLAGFLSNQKKLHLEYAQHLKKLHQTLLTPSMEISFQEKIKKVEALAAVNEDTLRLINENIQVANEYQSTLLSEKESLSLEKAKVNLHNELVEIRQQETALNHAVLLLYQKNTLLQQDKSNELNDNTRLLYEKRLMVNDQAIELSQHQLAALSLEKKLLKANYHILGNFNLGNLQDLISLSQKSLKQLELIENALKRMESLLKSENDTINDGTIKTEYQQLLTQVKLRYQSIEDKKQQLLKQIAIQNSEVKTLLSSRQHLSDYRLEAWPDIFSQLIELPVKAWTYLKSLMLKISSGYQALMSISQALLWLGLLILMGLAIAIRRLLSQVKLGVDKMRLSGYLIYGMIRIVYQNSYFFVLVMGLLFICYMVQIPIAGFLLPLSLLLIVLGYRVMVSIARMLLLERLSNVTGNDVKFYYRIRRLLISASIVIALMLISHQLPLSILAQDIFNRMFMVMLLAIALMIWRSKKIIPELINDSMNGNRRHLYRALLILLGLLPITLLITATIGMLGYINLAWSMSQYQGYLLWLLTCYIILRGLLLDGLEVLADWMVSRLKNGWLWVDVFLKPFDKLLRLLLLMGGGAILFPLFGWHSDSYVLTYLIKLIHRPLINLSGFYITPLSIFEFIIVLSIFVWAAKWTREFCYRWLFRDAREPGIRNSLSIFAQYSVILIGSLITLRVLGLDFSGLSMILGGLAVGMGFGLRDFASNIIGGIMLLIERPVREGDLITLGAYEGRVAHIGIRTMRVSSWDNMEVLIPNAETFNKPFTNWTHQDSIVRTVVPIKVSRLDCPNKVHQLITEVLANIPEIVIDPPFQVYLKQIDDALLEFELRYFINVELYTRVEIRSKVLFAIMDIFKAHGIKAPIPSLNIEVKEGE